MQGPCVLPFSRHYFTAPQLRIPNLRKQWKFGNRSRMPITLRIRLCELKHSKATRLRRLNRSYCATEMCHISSVMQRFVALVYKLVHKLITCGTAVATCELQCEYVRRELSSSPTLYTNKCKFHGLTEFPLASTGLSL